MGSMNRKVRATTANEIIFTTITELMKGTYAKKSVLQVDLCLVANINGLDVYENDVFGLDISGFADADGFHNSNIGKKMAEIGAMYVDVTMVASNYDLACNYRVQFKKTASDTQYMTENDCEMFDNPEHVYDERYDEIYEVTAINEGNSFIKYIVSKGAKLVVAE